MGDIREESNVMVNFNELGLESLYGQLLLMVEGVMNR